MKILYIDMDNVLVDFKSRMDSLTAQEKLEIEKLGNTYPCQE